jgi:phosphatidylinositol alpha-1,6-mannosyltransferase
MAKVLLLTLEYPPFKGGVANVYGNIAKHWLSPNDISVLHNNDNKLINNKLPFLKWVPSIWRLWRTIKKEKIDHILVGHILPLGTATYIVSKFAKIKYSVILHGMDLTFALKSNRKKWLAKKILNNAENIICMNSYTARLVKKVVGDNIAGRVEVVNPGVDTKTWKHENMETLEGLKNKYNLENKIILLSVGRLVKRKGFDKSLESLPSVLKQVPNLMYTIIGKGPEIENLKFKIENLGLKKNCILITNTTDNERNLWYQASDIFIMPSRNIGGDFEGFGIVFLEANLSGKPVIAGDSGGVGDAVENAVNGLLVDPEDTGDITYAIIKLAKDKELRKKLGEQGRERAINEFNWAKQVEKIYQIINK